MTSRMHLFYAGDMKDMLTQEFHQSAYGRPDVIITDPPTCRNASGCGGCYLCLPNPSGLCMSAATRPPRHATYNCLTCKYKVTAVQPVDMFPHTHHVENVVLLELREYVS